MDLDGEGRKCITYEFGGAIIIALVTASEEERLDYLFTMWIAPPELNKRELAKEGRDREQGE